MKLPGRMTLIAAPHGPDDDEFDFEVHNEDDEWYEGYDLSAPQQSDGYMKLKKRYYKIIEDHRAD